MFVLLGLIATVIISLATVVGALITAPEAYEGKEGLYIIRPKLSRANRVPLMAKSARSFFSIPEPTGLEPATSAVTGRRSNQLS
jgi:hypothetical protein